MDQMIVGKLENCVLQAKDAQGNIISNPQFDSAPAWSLSDASLGSLTVAADGLSAQFQSSGVAGVESVSVSAVAGGQSLSVSKDLQIAAGQIASIDIAFSPVS